MFHRVKSIVPLSDFTLKAEFFNGEIKIYDVKPLFVKWPVFKKLADNPILFHCVSVDTGGYGVVWNDDIDLSCDELYFNGIPLEKTEMDKIPESEIEYA